jgi:hypothetical protein
MISTVVQQVRVGVGHRKRSTETSESGVATLNAILLVVAVFLLGT